MSRHGQEVEMCYTALVGSVIGLEREKVEQVAPSGSQPAMW